MAFNGNLMYLGNDPFPMDKIFKESYTISPNRRIDVNSTRMLDGTLKRNVVEHMPSTISLQTKVMNNTEMDALMTFIRSHYVKESEKKLSIRFYRPDKNDYATAYFYMPDFEFPIRRIDGTTIYYNSITLEFIGY